MNHDDKLIQVYVQTIKDLQTENEQLRAKLEIAVTALELHSDAELLNPGVAANPAGQALAKIKGEK